MVQFLKTFGYNYILNMFFKPNKSTKINASKQSILKEAVGLSFKWLIIKYCTFDRVKSYRFDGEHTANLMNPDDSVDQEHPYGWAKKRDGVDYTMVNIGNPFMMLITQQCNHFQLFFLPKLIRYTLSTILVKV